MTDETFFELCQYERALQAKGYRLLGGVDEAGRGPLAGPVVAACVILPAEGPFPRANDSKKLSAKAREALYDSILDMALAYGVGTVDNETIDRINILNATHLAMKNAIEACGMTPDIVMVDHLRINGYSGEQFPLTHGDALSVTIGAASIIAKVTRDRLLCQYAEAYPEYGFEKHKGYGTKAHYEAIEKYGLTPIHRKTFLKKYL
jgi:ribonuclease HII